MSKAVGASHNIHKAINKTTKPPPKKSAVVASSDNDISSTLAVHHVHKKTEDPSKGQHPPPPQNSNSPYSLPVTSPPPDKQQIQQRKSQLQPHQSHPPPPPQAALPHPDKAKALNQKVTAGPKAPETGGKNIQNSKNIKEKVIPVEEVDKKRKSLLKHKTHLQESLRELDGVLSQDLSADQSRMTKSSDHVSSKSAIPTITTTHAPHFHGGAPIEDEPSFGKQKEINEKEEILDRKHYQEEEMDLEQLQAKLKAQEQEKCYEWIDKANQRVLFNTAIMVLIAAFATAFGCYIFVQLPKAIYSFHILNEVFLLKDELIENNGFSRGFGIRSLAPLPLVIIGMYMIILYSIWVVQNPKAKSTWRLYVRYSSFVFIELYLIVAALSYGINLGHVSGRMDVFFKMDMKGLKVPPQNKIVKFHYLDRSQGYFGCCGYEHREEWAKMDPKQYKGPPETWPLSCCDEKRSEVACYGPVEETVTFTRRNDEDDENPNDIVTHTTQRLFMETCRKMELMLCMTVISLVVLLTVIFIILETWNVVIFIKMTHLIIQKKIEIRHKEQYIDFF